MFAIKSVRTRKGFNQAEVAQLSGMPVRRYGSYEREERMLSFEDACKLADVFGCTLDELAGRTPPHAGDQIEGLTSNEGALVGAYRLMDDETKQQLIGIAKTFVVASEKDDQRDGSDVALARTMTTQGDKKANGRGSLGMFASLP